MKPVIDFLLEKGVSVGDVVKVRERREQGPGRAEEGGERRGGDGVRRGRRAGVDMPRGQTESAIAACVSLPCAAAACMLRLNGHVCRMPRVRGHVLGEGGGRRQERGGRRERRERRGDEGEGGRGGKGGGGGWGGEGREDGEGRCYGRWGRQARVDMQ